VSSAAELAQELVSWSAATGDVRRTRGQRALRYGLDNFGLEANVTRLEGLLQKLLADRPRR
jgi:hypothetical protein